MLTISVINPPVRFITNSIITTKLYIFSKSPPTIGLPHDGKQSDSQNDSKFSGHTNCGMSGSIRLASSSKP